MTEEQLDEYFTEVLNPFQLCPNLTEFQVRGSFLGDYFLQIDVKLTQKGKEFDG